MRLYALLNFQDIVLYVFPALIFMVLFGLALSYAHFRTKGSEERKGRVYYTFPEEIEDREEPVPVALGLIIAGTIIWAFFYILITGFLGVKI